MNTDNQNPNPVPETQAADNNAGETTANAANVLSELESMIKSNISGIDSRKSELKKTREMVASVLTNDATYKEREAKAKAAAKLKTLLNPNCSNYPPMPK